MTSEQEKAELLYRIYIEDSEEKNHRYVDEEQIVNAVRMGNIEFLESGIDEFFPQCTVIVKNSALMNEQFIAVASITLASRAAIEGGMSSDESFRLSDIFLMNIAEAISVSDVISIRNKAIIEYAARVYSIRRVRLGSQLVEYTKAYIKSNIFEPISLSDVAKALGINKCYLATVFKKEENMTIVHYIQQEKINMAISMLKYSDRSIVEIVNYLKIPSQSYFGKMFKREMGISPNEYRRRYHAPEF